MDLQPENSSAGDSGAEPQHSQGSADDVASGTGSTVVPPDATPAAPSNSSNRVAGVSAPSTDTGSVSSTSVIGVSVNPFGVTQRLGGTGRQTLRLSESEQRRLRASMEPGWAPPPPTARSLVLTESLRRVSLTAQMAIDAGRTYVTPSEIGDVFVQIGWRPAGSSNNHIGDLLGAKGLQLQRSPCPGGGSQYRLPDCDVDVHIRMLGYDI